MATLRQMAVLAREGSHSLRIRDIAVNLVKDCPPRDYNAETGKIFDKVSQNIRYTRDIRDIDTLHTCDTIINRNIGDCDDFSIILAALLLSIGHQVQFIAASFEPGQWSHVWVRDVTVRGSPLDLDAAEGLPLGQTVPLDGAELMSYDVDRLDFP